MFTANSMNCLTKLWDYPSRKWFNAKNLIPRRCSSRPVNASLILHVAVMSKMMPAHCPAISPHSGNAMALDIAMGGSTNTVLPLAASYEGEVGTMEDIDRLSRKVVPK